MVGKIDRTKPPVAPTQDFLREIDTSRTQPVKPADEAAHDPNRKADYGTVHPNIQRQIDKAHEKDTPAPPAP